MDFRQITDNLFEGCQILNFDWHYLYVNNAVLEHGRKSREELLDHRIFDVYPGIERTPLFKAMNDCMINRIPQKIINEFTFEDNSSAWYELSIQPAPEGILILSVDITNHKIAYDQLQIQLERLRTLKTIDMTILENTDLKKILNLILEETRARLVADIAQIRLYNPVTSLLENSAIIGNSIDLTDSEHVPLGIGICGLAAQERRTIAIPLITRSTLPRQTVLNFTNKGVKSVYATPLVTKGELIGTLGIMFHAEFGASSDWLEFFEALAGQSAMAIENATTTANLRVANEEIKKSYEMTIEGWSRALDLRDNETEGHSLRVTELTLEMAAEAGFSEEEMINIRRGALLHDIGKIGIPDSILLKQGELNEAEWEIMKKHPEYAYNLLAPIPYLYSCIDIPYCHHEKWDGTGYPRRLRGKEIPLSARLFAVVDVWDALSSDRPYRKGMPPDQIFEYLNSCSGIHFDPDALRLFLKMMANRLNT